MKNLILMIALCLLFLGIKLYGQNTAIRFDNIYGGDYERGCPIDSLDAIILGNPKYDAGHNEDCHAAILFFYQKAKVAYFSGDFFEAQAVAESLKIIVVAPKGTSEIFAFYHVPKIKKGEDFLWLVSITNNGGSDTQKTWSSIPPDTAKYAICIAVADSNNQITSSCGPNVNVIDSWWGKGGNARSFVESAVAGKILLIQESISLWINRKATLLEAKKIARLLAGLGSVDSLGRRESFGGVIDITPSKIDSVLRAVYGAPIHVSPVELANFVAKNAGNKVSLQWTTASETNNLGFAVERKRSNEEDWQEIAFIRGAGTMSTPSQYSYEDAPNLIGSISYRLRQVDTDGAFSYSHVVEVAVQAPSQFVLGQNFPNPFNSVTTIRYSLPADGNVRLTIYDMLGKEVAVLVDGFQQSGEHQVRWNASRLSSGNYFYRLETSGKVYQKMMTLLK